jgi:hypothetical protein
MLRKISREAPLGVHPGHHSKQPLARRADHRVSPSNLLTLERGAQHDVLARGTAIFSGKLRGNLERYRNGVLGLRLYLRYAQRVKPKHVIRCT